jgi:hypothetical protein
MDSHTEVMKEISATITSPGNVKLCWGGRIWGEKGGGKGWE